MIEVFVHGQGSQGRYINESLEWPADVREPVAGDYLRIGTRLVKVERVDFEIEVLLKEEQVSSVFVKVVFDD